VGVAEGLVTGTLGVAIPLFTIGVAVAVYFNTNQEKPDHSIGSALKGFLATPIFIAFLLGLVALIVISIFEVQEVYALADLFQGFFSAINHSVELLVWIAIGLMLHPLKAKTFLTILVLVICVKLILQPALVLAGAYAVGLPVLEQ